MSTKPKLSRRNRKAAERRDRFIRNLEIEANEALAARIIDPASGKLLDSAREAVDRLNRGRRLVGVK
jgi:hypothetical protein